MRRRSRLTRSRDFDTVYRHGRSVSTRYLTLYAFVRSAGDDPECRFGLALSRQIGDAVERNRLRRQLRACLDQLIPSAQPGYDYVLVARPGLAEATTSRGFDWLAAEVAEALRRSTGAETPA